MSDTFAIKIVGSNQSHQAFQQVTSDAKSMGTAVEDAGTKSGRSLQQLNQRAAAFGAALGGATLLMGEFTRAAADDAASQARLEQSVTNTGAAVDDYSASLEAAIKAGQQKAFSDDQTRDALVKLNLATNDTSKSIDELSLAMDLSRAKGISLSQSAELIGKVYQGQYGALSRMGIVISENATKEEALAAIQQRVAGQAQTYAETSVGRMDIFKDKIDEMTEAWGAHAGALQSVLMMLPGLQAGYVALAGALGGLGLGGAATVVGGGVVAADLLSLYLAYDVLVKGNQQAGGNFADKFYGTTLSMGAGIAQKLTPGSIGDQFFQGKQAQFQGVMDQNDVENMFAQLFFGVNTVEDVARVIAPILQKGGFGGPVGFDIKNIPSMAAANYQTNTEYISSQAALAGFVYDPGTQQFLSPSQQLGRRFREYGGYSGMGAGLSYPSGPGPSPYGDQGIYNPFPSRGGTVADYYGQTAMAYRAGGMGAVANDVSGMGGAPVVLSQANQDLANAANAAQYSAALRDQYGAYAKLIEGVNAAQGASMAFKATQDGLLDSEGVYSQQIGEFTSQINAMSAAHDILNQRVEEGGTLTKEQQEFQDNYNAALERGTGGVEDATLAQGMLAEQYLLNMEKGDQINDALQSQTESTASLVTAIQDLVLSMEGVPEEVRTRILLEQDQAMSDLLAYQARLGQIPRDISTTLTVYPNYGSDVLRFIGGGGGQLHGGVVGYDNGGVVIHAGEAGPEFMHFANGGSAWASSDSLYSVPRGTYVTPAPASVGKGGGRGGITINGNVIVMANDARQMEQSIREYAMGNSRS